MYRLRDRNKQIPGGYQYYLPQTKWQSTPWASLDAIGAALLAHLQGNPAIAAKLGWPLDLAFLTAQVEQYNADLCAKMGWNDYLAVGRQPAPAPFPQDQTRSGFIQRARNAVVGLRTLIEWIGTGAEAVPREQAISRSMVCVGCPFNEHGDLLSFFTRPVSEAIRGAYNQRAEWNLQTPVDEKLGVCAVCSCPLKLLIHLPVEMKLKHMDAKTRAQLPPHCWVVKESVVV